MFYYSTISRKKIIHHMSCPAADRIHDENIECFETLQEAYGEGYRLCRHCSLLARQYRKGESDSCTYSQEKGIAFFYTDRALVVTTSFSKWKIVPSEDGLRLQLYHQNTHRSAHDWESLIPGYHLQNAKRDTIQGYLEYIAEHDDYRLRNPVQTNPKTKKKDSTPPKKGTRRYKKQRRREEIRAKKYSIRRTLDLIDGLHCQKTGLQPA